MEQYRWVVGCIILIVFSLTGEICWAGTKDADKDVTIQQANQPCKVVRMINDADVGSDPIIEKFSFFAEKLKEDIDSQLAVQEAKITQLETAARTNEKSISNYLTIVTFFAGAVLGLVALVLGLGAYRFYMDNKQIVERLNRLLEEQFGPWLAEREKECQQELKKLYSYYYAYMGNLMYYLGACPSN